MHFSKNFTLFLISFSVFVGWSHSAQAQGILPPDPVETVTPSTDNLDSLGELACFNISSSLKQKINQQYLRQKGITEQQLQESGIKIDDIDEAKSFPLKLHYLRNASNIVQFAKDLINNTNQTDSNQTDNNDCPLYVTNYGNDTLILNGETRFIEHVYRIIAAMDLPRPGINMEIYGIQVSSDQPKKMAKAMSEVRKEISKTQLLIQETYSTMQQLARTIDDDKIDEDFKAILENGLGYEFALDANRPLTLTDILILLSATNDKKTGEKIANAMSEKFKQARFKDYTDALRKLDLCPFEGFFRSRGLKLKSDNISATFNNSSANPQIQEPICKWENDKNVPIADAIAARIAILDFALHYSDLIERPNSFDPHSLQQTADVLNTQLRAVMNIINRDIENMFMLPTLDNIREIVRGYNSVTYAQIGKTTVAGLSGLPSSVTGEVQSNFDITPPLRLMELLQAASANKDIIEGILPNLVTPINLAPGTNQAVNGTNQASNDTNQSANGTTLTQGITLEPTVGPLPLSSFLGILAAYDNPNRTQRLTLGASGPNLTVTPYVLRNMSSAELSLNLTVGDPLEGTSEANEDSLPLVNLSRVTEHTVNTTVYVDAVDLFTISTFSNQSSIDGGRGYVPVIGTIWRGIFDDIPVIGKLFSWEKDTQSVYHESILLTNSYITPTVMGLALKYPTRSIGKDNNQIFSENKKQIFLDRQKCVEHYKRSLGRNSESNNTENSGLTFSICKFLN
ncbi:MAG: hypothetical protein AAGA80_25475 [Cyanobacteria bacterium P01_F01_bin.143]